MMLSRITPACAGKSAKAKVDEACNKDHPRVCGEKALSTFSSRKNSGSPPRVRGKGVWYLIVMLFAGITPAYAGKSSTATLAAHSTGDHPRVCGEKTSHKLLCSPVMGSPPRVRGKVISSLQCDFLSGITPAYAGKRCVYSAQNQSLRDHPRVCGEKTKLDKRNVATKGSPPRMRGKVSNVQSLANRSGITPACAGKSCRLRQLHGAYRDHPRVCGEKLPAAA